MFIVGDSFFVLIISIVVVFLFWIMLVVVLSVYLNLVYFVERLNLSMFLVFSDVVIIGVVGGVCRKWVLVVMIMLLMLVVDRLVFDSVC